MMKMLRVPVSLRSSVAFRRPWLLALLLQPLAGAADLPPADQQVFRALADMTRAMRERNYQGTFVIENGGQLGAMRVLHRNDQGGEWNHVYALNGLARSVTLQEGHASCSLDGAALEARGLFNRYPALSFTPETLAGLAEVYRFFSIGHSRIADREVQVVAVAPRDQLRFGYRFFIDKDSSLPLKYDVMDAHALPVQQLMFTELHLDPDWSAMAPPAASKKEVAPPKPPLVPGKQPSPQFQVDERQLPPFFKVQSHTAALDADGQPMEQFFISDGLASLSIFIERPAADEHGLHSRIGSVTMVRRHLHDRMVTLIGKVPEPTVDRVLDALQLEATDSPKASATPFLDTGER